LSIRHEVGKGPGDSLIVHSADGTRTRTTTYTYQSINGRSVLVQIDGPLKNGPKNSPEDSETTTFAYDQRADYLIATAPMQPKRCPPILPNPASFD
jgi:hypothetical protein